MNERKVIQITTAAYGQHLPELVALCNDGSMWIITMGLWNKWLLLPDVPKAELQKIKQP